MKRFLLDTGSAGDYINRRYGVLEKAKAAKKQGHKIGIGIPVLAELYAGVELSATAERNRLLLIRAMNSLFVWPFDKIAAQEYGRIFADLRRRGRPIQQIDIQIASIALTLGNCTVVTKDSDFNSVPGLKIVNWSSPRKKS
jgi:tRNA(fMet)-specific endonuclease VapC